jgi:hypothetical protein
MSRLPFEAFLALRYLRPRRTFVSVITLISIMGVLLGVMVMIIVIAVMSGFDQQWRDRIMSFNAHLKVYGADQDQMLTNYPSLMRVVAANPDVTGVSPFVRSIVMLKTEPAEGKPRIYAPFLAGVDPESLGRVSIVPGSIVAGSFDLADNGLSSAINRAEGLPRSILKHLPNRAFEPITELLQGLQGDVLVPHLKPVQGGIRQPSFPCKLLIRKVSALLPQPRRQSFSQSVLCHPSILRLALSHKWDF